MARPSKHKYKDAARMNGACVYVFLDGSVPVYVGKTTNIKKRFQPYSALKCHNEGLNNWLRSSELEFDVLIYRADDIDSLERELIREHKSSLFNLSNGNENDWYTQNSTKKPWVAGRGILSPISEMLRKTTDKRKKEEIRGRVASMTDKERCVAEVRIAMSLPTRFSRWLDLTQDKLILCMESSNG